MDDGGLLDTSIRITDITVAFSVLVAIMTFALTQYWQRRQEWRQNTLRLLMSLVESPALHDANMLMLEAHDEGRPLNSATLTQEERRKVVLVLNYYEQICTSAADGHLDRKMIKHLRQQTITRICEQCEAYITERRRQLEQDNLYANLRSFAKSTDGQ